MEVRCCWIGDGRFGLCGRRVGVLLVRGFVVVKFIGFSWFRLDLPQSKCLAGTRDCFRVWVQWVALLNK